MAGDFLGKNDYLCGNDYIHCRMMNEFEKREEGLLYNPATDPEMLDEIHRCEQWCFDYNRTSPGKLDSLTAQLRNILGSTGERVRIIQPFKCDYGYNVHVGEDFFANCNLVILDAAQVTFGDHVFVGPNCGFYTAGHPLDITQRNMGLESARPIIVGNDVWIGGNVCVMPGVTIGDGCVIGAGSVVTRDIPPHTLAMGNPCHPIRDLKE